VETSNAFYRTKEIVELSKGNNISLELFISEKRYAEIKSKFDLPQMGDILISAVGTIGVMWTVDTEKPFYFKDGNLILLKSSKLEHINTTYLRMTLEHLIEFEKYKLAEGGAYNALTIAKLKEFNVLLATSELQNQFAEKIALIEQQKALAKQELQESEDLFNCLLQKAFKGELM
jgi:type I restriction enzyme S subunit